jgi:hypothetical protein
VLFDKVLEKGGSRHEPTFVRWHYTAMEQVTVIRGRLEIEMTGHGPAALGAGGFAAMPGKMAHQFVCSGKQECLLLVSFDGVHDIFWGKGI